MVAELNFASSIFPVTIAGLAVPGYAAVWSLILNIAASMALTALLRLVRAPRASDETSALDYI